MRYHCLFLVLLSSLACQPKNADTGAAVPKSDAKNILFVTLDTTRADRIGCYGYAPAATPAIDGLAARGIRFARAYAQVPLTLPSHASMLTGKYPRELGVRDNGRGGLASQHLLLSEIAAKSGMRTAAFVAAFVLDSRFGLHRGFDLYDDEMDVTSVDTQLLDQERRGNVVADRAIRWLEADRDRPFFCWVHFYDPHHPYEPPAEYRKQHGDPYDGEIAFTDDQLARILDVLRRDGRLDKTLVMIVGDHGESFGEHGEKGHTTFLYDTNLHVPFIVAGPGIRKGVTSNAVVEIVSVFKTVCDMMNWAAPEDLLSDSLAPALAGHEIDSTLSYGESHFAFNAHRWAEQRSVTSERWKYISSTKPELYDLKADPAETMNLITRHPDEARRLYEFLAKRYSEMKPGKSAAVAMDARAQRAIESLGYAGGAESVDTGVLTPGLPDPKDMLPLVNALADARKHAAAGRFAEARALLLEPARLSPNSIEILSELASCEVNLGNIDEADKLLRRALAIDPAHSAAIMIMGDLLYNAGRFDEAARHFEAVAALEPGDAVSRYRLGLSLARMQRFDDAITALRDALAIFPTYEEAAAELLKLCTASGQASDAVAIFADIAKDRPADAKARLNHGVALLAIGKWREAAAELAEAVRLDPDLGVAYNKLGICHARAGEIEQAVRMFQKAATYAKSRAEAYYNLGVTDEKADRLQSAIQHYRAAIETDPANSAAITAKVRLLLRLDQTADAVRVLRAGAANCPNDLSILNTLADILATDPRSEIRDGPAAVAYAELACRLTDAQHPGLLATLAAAYAEAEQFERAIATAERAAAIARSQGHADLADVLETHIRLYRSGSPVRNQ